MKTINEIVELLIEAKDAYYNSDMPILTDDEYDNLEAELKLLDPNNSFFMQIGSEVRGNKVELPYKMGSLDQVHDSEIEKWITKRNLLNEEFVVTSKMDGVSCCLIYNNTLNIVYSRGDGIKGLDITRHIKQIPELPKEISLESEVAVRGEVIISEENFKLLNEESNANGCRIYKNARNAVAGILNSKTNPEWIYKYLSVFVYEIMNFTQIHKTDQLRALSKEGFDVVQIYICIGYELTTNALKELIELNKQLLPYEQDGVVVEIDDYAIRNTYPIKNSNPEYAWKYKILDENNFATTEVQDVIWAVSKNGLLKPRIEVTPVQLQGVTITFATGFNAKFVNDNMIGPGSIIKIVRSGDVIPHIVEIIEAADEALMPDIHEFGEYKWSNTKVDLEILDKSNNDDVIIKRMCSFFTSINAPLLKEQNLKKLYMAGFITYHDIINMSKDDMIEVLGVNGGKAYTGLYAILSDIFEYELAGATHFFGEGVGVRKMKKLYESHHNIRHLTSMDILNTDGFDEITTEKVVNGMMDYVEFLENVKPDIIVFKNIQKNVGKLEGTNWVFTGVRDKDAQTKIESLGGQIKNSISKTTTHLVAKDTTSTSSKMKKANDLGVKILTLSDMYDIIENS